jgi:hypothetical protein
VAGATHRTGCPSTSRLKKQSVGDSVPEEIRGAVHRSAETDAGVAAITLTCPRVLFGLACIPEVLRFESWARHYGTARSSILCRYRGADKSLARPGRKQVTATEDFEFHISYL